MVFILLSEDLKTKSPSNDYFHVFSSQVELFVTFGTPRAGTKALSWLCCTLSCEQGFALGVGGKATALSASVFGFLNPKNPLGIKWKWEFYN